MNTTYHCSMFKVLISCGILTLCGHGLQAACSVSETTRKIGTVEQRVMVMENDRIRIEIAPELAGKILVYQDKRRPATPFEEMDDCPYHYSGRWESKGFTGAFSERGPDRASITVAGGGKVPSALLRTLGLAANSEVRLTVERTMSIDATSSRVVTHVTIRNAGESVAPQLRYMVHAVYGQVPPMPEGRAFWFLPTSRGIEFFSAKRGMGDMRSSAGGAPLDHPFSRFVPGLKSDKPRYEPQGWGAAMTSAGPAFIIYDPSRFEYMQYWFGGDSTWHFTFEPTTKAVDLRPGEAVSWDFTLSYDAADLPLASGKAFSFEIPEVPDLAAPGTTLPIHMRATTVATTLGSLAKARFTLSPAKPGAAGAPSELARVDLAGEVGEFKFTELSGDLVIPANAAHGNYVWTASAASGETIATGALELVPLNEIDSRRITKAIQVVNDEAAAKQKELNTRLMLAMGNLTRAETGLNYALGTGDPERWPVVPSRAVSISTQPNAVEVLGRWQERELPRIDAVEPVPAITWNLDIDVALALLGPDRPLLRDVAYDAQKAELLCLIVDPARKRSEVVRVGASKVLGHFGAGSEKPGENDGTLGLMARAISIDPDGGIWVATDAWGPTSQYHRNQDGQPYEEIAPGRKGAIKHFTAKGLFVDAIPLLDIPLALASGMAGKDHLLLASYRNVSAYHGAQVREGVVLINTATGKKAGEIKVSGGSLAVGSSHLWISDVAGRTSSRSLSGHLDFAVEGARPAAPLELKPIAEEPMPVLLALGSDGGCWFVERKERRLSRWDAHGKPGESTSLPKTLGDIVSVKPSARGVLLIGTRGTASYPQ